MRCGDEFCRVGDELPTDHIVRPVNQREHRRGNCDGIALLHRRRCVAHARRDQSGRNQGIGIAQRRPIGVGGGHHGGRR